MTCRDVQRRTAFAITVWMVSASIAAAHERSESELIVADVRYAATTCRGVAAEFGGAFAAGVLAADRERRMPVSPNTQALVWHAEVGQINALVKHLVVSHMRCDPAPLLAAAEAHWDVEVRRIVVAATPTRDPERTTRDYGEWRSLIADLLAMTVGRIAPQNESCP
jgi:hypothetical protein